ncbi:MAG: hypothetical protein AVDCRST_MAG91-1963, partial [uncultured Sphingomonadaceae bacterium]
STSTSTAKACPAGAATVTRRAGHRRWHSSV